ncbi:MAG: gliding motility protein GldL [Muribaculaceae bacterium]|nr:gliding motility protein GldL [Muribaculaceae bacterium]
MSEKKRGGLSGFISSHIGQRFFNFAYSIGAAIVIWGALFKILHLPGGNTLLSIGMGTEVLMFILTAFDRPPKEYDWEEVFPQLKKGSKDSEEETEPDVENPETEDGAEYDHSAAAYGGPSVVYVNGGSGAPQSPASGGTAATAVNAVAVAGDDTAGVTHNYIEEMRAITDELASLRSTTQALNQVSDVLLNSYRVVSENSEDITRSSEGYVKEMQSLSHNLAGLNGIYEFQLKSIATQLDAIERVNKGIKDIRDMYEKSASQSARYCEETEKMARYMQQLNSVYERMITAMTVNMMPGMMPGAVMNPKNGSEESEN